MDMDQIFCSNQISIPPTLPSVLKKYSKAAIRTQPYDLLVWSAAYFKAMATGVTPPVKARLEFPFPAKKELSLGYVKLLVYQLGRVGQVGRDELIRKWKDVSLPETTLHDILRLGSFFYVVDWTRFVAIAVGFLESSLKGTMIRLCEVMTEEPDGGSASIPSETFLSLYRYLGEMDCGVAEVEKVSAAVPPEEKRPCLPEEQDRETDSGRDIDSVIREIGEVESTVSVATRLEGEGLEFDWPDIGSESGSDATELRLSSEPSDTGATSRYGIEVMDGGDTTLHEKRADEGTKRLPSRQEGEEGVYGEYETLPRPERGELKALLEERRRDQKSDRDSDISKDAEEESAPQGEGIRFSSSLTDVLATVNSQQQDDMMKRAAAQAEQRPEDEETSEPESGSVKTLMGEKEEESPSEKDSQHSETKKGIYELDDTRKKGLRESTSLVDVRTTMDRELRKKTINDALIGEEKRKEEEANTLAKEKEKLRTEEETKEAFHLHVPGIGPKLPQDLMVKLEEYMRCCAARQSSMVMPRNIRHFLCPPVDLESLAQTQGLAELLDQATQLPEFKTTPSTSLGVLEVIKQGSAFDLESSAGSLSRTSVQSNQLEELSMVSVQAQAVGRSTSLECLLTTQERK